jgi:hypothetical protein
LSSFPFNPPPPPINLLDRELVLRIFDGNLLDPKYYSKLAGYLTVEIINATRSQASLEPAHTRILVELSLEGT